MKLCKGLDFSVLETYVEFVAYCFVVQLNSKTSGLAVAKLQIHSPVSLRVTKHARAWRVNKNFVICNELYKVTDFLPIFFSDS